MSNAFLAQLPHIGSTSTLGWQNDALAQSYMDHILQRARVLLPRRGWRVGVIKEFYPRGAALLGLNVNAGSEVCVRFRVPGRRNEFLPFHEVLCTALHEFTHCVHSRHDRAFWNLYYDLVKECEALEVTMIQQGKQLYPEAAYVPQYKADSGAAPPSRGARGKTTSTTNKTPRAAGSGTASFPSKGGHRLGGAQGPASGGSAGRGGTTTRSRSGTTTTTVTARPGRGATPATSHNTASPVFPGAGRRLGEGSTLRPYDDASPGFTPTRDALRRILAAATERRLRSGDAAARAAPSTENASTDPTPNSNAPTSVANTGNNAEGGAVVDEDDVPDHIPVSQSAMDDSDGSWRCPRCGFCNAAGTLSCQLCDNDDSGDAELDGEDAVCGGCAADSSVLVKEEPPVKKERIEGDAAPAALLEEDTCPSLPASANVGTSKDNAVAISDDEDEVVDE